MTVDLRSLVDFLDLARTGNFSASARNRSISQPALTRRIQRLEEWVGKLLFDRSAIPLRLTSTGEEFVALATRIVDELMLFRQHAAHDSGKTRLRCMTIHSLGTAFLPNWFSDSADGRAHSMPEISFGTYDHCFAALRENEVDVALLYYTESVREVRFKGLCRQFIGAETFIPVACSDYARQIDGQPGAGASVPVVIELSRDNYLGKALSPAFDHCKRRLGYVLGAIAMRIDAARGFVDAGCGIGWLPESMVRADLAAGRLRRVENRVPGIKLDVAFVATSAEKLELIAELREPAQTPVGPRARQPLLHDD